MGKLGKLRKVVIDNNNIERVVLKCFVRVIKNRGKYMLYRKDLGANGLYKALFRKKRSCDSPFASAENNEDVIKILAKITAQMEGNDSELAKRLSTDKYERITVTINHLLHFFMEANGVSMKNLCDMGEEIYCMSCKILYGDDYEETIFRESKRDSMPNGIPDIVKEYVDGLRNGLIPESVSIEQFARMRINGNNPTPMSETTDGNILGLSYDELVRMHEQRANNPRRTITDTDDLELGGFL